MIKKIKTYKDLPFEVGKTYQTKMSVDWTFLVKEIEYKKDVVSKLKGIWSNSPDLGICEVYRIERIIPDKVVDGEMEVCGNCGNPL